MNLLKLFIVYQIQVGFCVYFLGFLKLEWEIDKHVLHSYLRIE